MHIKKVFLLLSEEIEAFNDKWWNRLFIVLFTLWIIASKVVVEYYYNINVKNILRSFSENSDKSVANTTYYFLEQGDKFVCVEEGGRITPLSRFTIRDEALCSADISVNIEEVAKEMLDKWKDRLQYSIQEIKGFITEVLNEDKEKRYCFISKNINCSSDDIIYYKRIYMYYL
jgi:hypothetical protein